MISAAINAGMHLTGNEADEEGDHQVSRDRKSPSLPRKSPGMRSLGSRGRGDAGPTQVLDYMYLGSMSDARDVEFLRSANIKKIINVSSDEYLSPKADVEILWLKSEDTCDFDISVHFSPAEAALSAIRRKYFEDEFERPGSGARVLVHCLKGRSRSVTIVLAHLIRHNGWSVAEALQYVSGLREHVEPNLGFFEALRTYAAKFKRDEQKPSRKPDKRSARKMARVLVVRFPFEGEDEPRRPFPIDAKSLLRDFFSKKGLVVDIKVRESSRSPRPVAAAITEGEEDSAAQAMPRGAGGGRSSSTDGSGRRQSGRPSQSSSTTSPQRERVETVSSSRMTRADSDDVTFPPVAVYSVEFACQQSVDRVIREYEDKDNEPTFSAVLGRPMLLRALLARKRKDGKNVPLDEQQQED